MTMNKMQGFVMWLDGFLDASEGSINVAQTKTIGKKLNDLFEHEAEPPKNPNPTLEELGEQHGFDVTPGFPGRT
jgi:hypothetical protein